MRRIARTCWIAAAFAIGVGGSQALEVPPEPPEFYGEEVPVEDAAIVFIVDASGSMSSHWQTWEDDSGGLFAGNRMDRAKAEISQALLHLPEEYRFDVLEFTCDFQAWAGELRQANEANKVHRTTRSPAVMR